MGGLLGNDLIGALPHIAEETFNGIDDLNGAVHGSRKRGCHFEWCGKQTMRAKSHIRESRGRVDSLAAGKGYWKWDWRDRYRGYTVANRCQVGAG